MDFRAESMEMTRRLTVIALAVCALALFQAPAGGGKVTIKATGSAGSFQWQPDFKHITVGTKVVWKNTTTSTHTVKAYTPNWKKNSDIDANGGKTSKTFKKKGSYLYRCTQPGHSSVGSGGCTGMCGEIHVTK